MNTPDQVKRLIAGAVEGAESVLASACGLAAQPTAESARAFTARVENLLYGAQRTVRAIIEAEETRSTQQQ